MIYSIWSNGRSGSILAANLIGSCLKTSGKIVNISYNERQLLDILTSSSDSDIVVSHTHSIPLFSKLLDTDNVVSLVITRNIFELTLSYMIAKQFEIFTLRTKDYIQFRQQHKNSLFYFKPEYFVNYCYFFDRFYTEIFKLPKEKFFQIDYSEFANDLSNLLERVGLPKDYNRYSTLPKKTPIDKESQISNFKELKEIYSNLDIKNHF